MIESFKEIFTGLERAHGVTKVGQSNGDGTKVQGKSFIKREPVTDELWLYHLQGRESLGIIPINKDPELLKFPKNIDFWKRVSNWKKKGWINAAKKPVANKELWEKLESLVSNHKVKWEWVKGHSGDAENERADELARKGIQDII